MMLDLDKLWLTFNHRHASIIAQSEQFGYPLPLTIRAQADDDAYYISHIPEMHEPGRADIGLFSQG